MLAKSMVSVPGTRLVVPRARRCAFIKKDQAVRPNLQRTHFRNKDEAAESAVKKVEQDVAAGLEKEESVVAPEEPIAVTSSTQTTETPTTLAGIAYGSLAVCTSIAAATALLFPQQLSKLVLNYDPSAIGTTLIRLTGASLILDVAVKTCLKAMQPVNRSEEPARAAAAHLNWALIAQSVGSLVLLLQATSVRNPVLMSTIGLLAAATAFVAGSEVFALRPTNPISTLQRISARVLSFFIPETFSSAIYSFVTIALAYGGHRMLYSWPGVILGPFTQPLDPVLTLSARSTGWSLLLAALVALVLRDVTDKQRAGKTPSLSADSFKVLNLGMAGSTLVSAAVLAFGAHAGAVATSNFFWGVVGSLVAIGAWAGFQSTQNAPTAAPAV